MIALSAVLVLAPLPSLGVAAVKPLTGGAPEPCPVAHIRLNVTYSCALEFTLPASHGYRITVSADPGGGLHSVQLIAESRSGTAEYLVSGTVTSTKLVASFGKLGRISVRFRPSGVTRSVRIAKSCLKERPPLVSSRLGSFRGTIVFHGEHGFTRVAASHARGGVGDPLTNTAKKKPQCEHHESAAEKRRELEAVSLDGAPSNSTVAFTAFPAPKGSAYAFLAYAAERAGKMFIARYAGVGGGAEDFVFDDALTTATVTPPAPFSGTGNFRRNPDGAVEWSGDLAISLPGLGQVKLTGGKAELATVATHLKQLEEEIEHR